MTDTHPTSPRGTPPAPSWGRRLAASAAGLLLLAGFGSAQAQLTVDPTSRDFGNVLVGATEQQVFTISNASGGPLTINESTFDPFLTQYTLRLDLGPEPCSPGNSIPFTILNGESCTVVASFTPDAASAFSTTVRVWEDFALTNQLVSFGLQGTGTAPADPNPVVVSPASLDLTPTNGDEASALVQFTNPGPGSVSFDANESYSPPTSGLTHGGSTSCRGATLGVGQSCQFEVLWNADGFRAIQTDIQLGAAGFTPAIISVRAIYNGLTANVTLNRGTLGLQQVTLSNTSGGPVSLTSLSLTGDPQFSIEPSSTCTPTTTLLAAETCVVDILFTQQAVGPASATLSFTTDALPGDPANVLVSATGVPLPPSEPRSVGATAGNASADVEWLVPLDDGGTPITGYTVTSSPASAGCSTAGLSCTVSGLTNGTPYTFTVIATNAAGTSDPSAPSSAVTPAGQPDEPAPPTGTAGNGQISLTWAAPNPNGSPITGYNVRIATDVGGPYADPAGTCGNASTVTSTATTCVASGLTNGQTYFFRVAAINAVGGYDDLSAPSDGITPAGPPSAPTLTSLTAGNNAFTINWTNGAANGSDVTGVTVTASPGSDLTCSSAGTSCAISGLINGTNYTFTAVTNSDDQGPSGNSNSLNDVAAYLTPPTIELANQLLNSSRPSALFASASCGSATTSKRYIPYVVRLENTGNHFFETRTGNFDTVLQIRNAGNAVVVCDDDGGAGTLSRIVLNNPTAGALYTIELTHYGSTAREGTTTLCFGQAGDEGECGFVAPSETQSVITSTSTGIEARTNEAFTVNYTLFSNLVGTKVPNGMRVSARNSDDVEVGFCVGDIGDVDVITGIESKPEQGKAQPKGSVFTDEATGSCVLSGLKPSDGVTQLVAVFAAQTGYLASESAPFGFTVTRSNTSTQLNNNGPTAYGADIVLSALFNATSPGANPVTGTARFVRQPGNVTIVEVPIVPGIEGAASTATTTITTSPDVALSPITYNVVILDNTDFIGSNNSTVHTVTRANTAVTIDAITPAVGPGIEVNETVTVTATVAAITGAGTPNGTVQVRGTGGAAAATTGCDITLSGGTGSCDLSFSTKGGATLVFSYIESANFAASSNSQAATVLGLPVVMTLTPPAGPIYFGNSYDVGYSLSGGAGNFDGAVTMSAAGATPRSVTCTSTSAPLNNAGVCSFAGDQNVGAYEFDGDYAGDTQDLPTAASALFSIQQATTSLTVGTDPTSSAAGAEVEFSATLTLTSGTGLLNGTIELVAGGLTGDGSPSQVCINTITDGVSPVTVTCDRAFTLFGTWNVDAEFTPASTNFAGADAPTATHSVTSAMTTPEIGEVSPFVPQVGDALSFGFSVDGCVDSCDGDVQVSVGSGDPIAYGAPIACTFTPASGLGSCTVPAGNFQAVGQYSLRLEFVADDGANDASSSSDVVVNVGKRDTIATLTAVTNPVQAGVAATFNISIEADGGDFAAGTIPSGEAWVCESLPCGSSNNVCSAILLTGASGETSGSCQITFQGVTTRSLFVSYGGNDNFEPSSDELPAFETTPRDTSIAINTLTPATTLVGQPLTVNFTVSGGAGDIEGTVDVIATGPGGITESCLDATLTPTTGTATGSCTFRVGNGNGLEQVGNWTFAASFVPAVESNDAGSNTGPAAASRTVTQATTTLVLSSAPEPSVFGQAFTLTATVTADDPSEGYPTGDVNFFDGESNAIGVVTLAPTATPGVSTASIANLTRDVAPAPGWRFVAATITNPNFAGANDFGYDHLVNRDNQTVAVTALTSLPFADGGSFNVSAVATAVFTNAPSGQAVELSAGPAGVCSGSGSSSGGSNVSISILGGGTCVITASVPQSQNYNLVAPQTVNVEITPIEQTISFAALPNRPAAAGTFELVATAPAGAVSFASTTTHVCTVSGTTVSYVAAGVCSITASQPGNASYNAAPDVVQSFAYVAVTVGPETLDDGTRNAAYSAQFTASGTGAVLPFTFTVGAGLPPGLNLAADGALTGTPTSAGSYTFTVTATDSSDVPNLGTPYSGSREYTLVIAKNPQDITGFAVAPTTLVYLGPAGTLSATGGGSGNTVVFSSLTEDFCTVSGNQVTPVAAGLCTVAANQAGNIDYEDAPQETLDVFVAKAEQDELTAAASPATVAYLQTSALTVTGGTTNGDVTYVVTAGETFCSITGSTLTATLAGDSCTVTATMAGNDNYLPVSDTVVVNTIKAQQVDFAVDADPSTIQYTATSALSTTGGNGDGTVNYEITGQVLDHGTNVCSLLNSTITGDGIGSCTITATKAADANYEEAVDTVVITVVEADQTLTFGNNPGPLTIGGATGSVVATATSGLPVTYGVAAGSATVCTVNSSDGSITMLTAGDCVITANQAGDDFYNPATQVTQTVVIDKEQPSISLVGSGSPTSPGNAVTFTATVAGGFSPTGTVTFQNDGADIAGCVNVALTGLVAECVTTALPQGSHPITANYNGDVNNLTATSNTVTQVVLTGTTITLNPANLIEARFGQSVDVAYTVSGGVAPNEGNVTVTATRPGSTVTCTAPASAGTCTLIGLVTTGPVLADGYTVTAAYAGDPNDGASTTAASQTLNVLRSNTNTLLTIAPVTSSPFGQGFTLTATVTAVAPGGGIPPGTIVFLRDGESIGEIALNASGVAVFNVPAGLAVGNYVFRAEYAQTTNYLQSFENRNYAVTAKATTTTITSSTVNPSELGAAVGFNYTVTTSPADTTPTGTVTLTASTGETCSASVAVGTCPITFNTAGARTLTAVYVGDSVHATSTSVAFAHNVNKGNQAALTAIATPDEILFGGTSTLSTTGGTGTGAVSFAVTAGGSFCEISGNTLSGTGVGTCTVTATKAGDDNYEPTSATVAVTVGRAPQAALVVTATPDTIVYLGTSALATTGGSGTGAVSYAVTGGTGSCAILDSTLTGNEVGTCVVTATKLGGDNYEDQTGTVTVTVEKAPQTITFGANPGPLSFGGTSGSVSATASSGLAVSFSTASTVCSVDAVSGLITILGAGDCVVAANQAGDDNYLAAPEATQTVVINKAAQTITFNANPGPFTFGGAAGSVSATASSGLAVTYSTASTAVCAVDATTGAITINGAGNCVVAANQAGDDDYAPAPEATQTVVINKAAQTITFNANPGPLTFGGTSGSVSATASSGLAVSYSTASAVCSVDAVSGAITMIGAGDCVVAANQAGNDNYLPAPEVTQTVVINPGNQQPLVVTATPNPVIAGQTSALTTTGGSGNGAVSFAVTEGGANCTIAGSTLTAVQAGTCTVTATKAADANYLVQTGSVVVTVNPATVDLSIVKTGRYTLSGITWELLVSNAGPGVANGASVIDALPSEVNNASWTCATNSGGGTCVTANGTGDVEVDVNLPANSSVVITITAAVVGTPAAISNTASVVAPDGITDTNPSNNTTTLNLTVALFADGFEGNGLTGSVLKSSGGVVEVDGAQLEGVIDGYKSVNAVRYSLNDQQLQLQVREVNGLLQVRLLQSDAKQNLSSTRWIEVWPGDAVRIDYALTDGELSTRLAVGAK